MRLSAVDLRSMGQNRPADGAGHQTLKEVELYTKAADRIRLASTAIDRLDKGKGTKD